MSQQNEQEQDIGQSPEDQEKLLSPMSQPKRTKSLSSKDEQESQPLKSGSPLPLTTNQSLSESESENSSNGKGKRKNLMPVPKLTVSVDRKDQALKRLKVKPETLATAPQITPTIKSSVKGGLKAALGAMRFATDDPDIGAFLRKYDSIPVGDRDVLPWEAIALAANVNTRHLIGSIVLAVASLGATKSKLLIASNHPYITKSRIEFGKLPSGERDRTALDIMAGAQKSPNGATFIGNAVFGSLNQAGNKDVDDDGKSSQNSDDDKIDHLFPSVVGIQEKLIPIRQKLLEG